MTGGADYEGGSETSKTVRLSDYQTVGPSYLVAASPSCPPILGRHDQLETRLCLHYHLDREDQERGSERSEGTTRSGR